MKYVARITASVLVLLTIFSCSKSKDDIVVADVNGTKITLARFEQSYKNVEPKFLPPVGGFEGHKQFLETMINKEVMAQKADELGYDKDPYVVQGIEVFKKMGLQAAYLKFRVADKVKITEDDIRDYYDKDGITLTVKQILVDTIEEAEEVYQLLLDGNDFETICKRYSKSPDASIGGKVMTAAFGGFAPDFQDELFDLPVGGICSPIETPYGFFVIKVLKKEKKANARPFEQVHEKYERIARGYQEMMLSNDLSESIRQAANWEWHYDGIRTAFEALPPDRPLTNPPPRSSEKYPLLHFTEEELAKPILSYNDKVLTVADFSDLYDKSSFFERPRRSYRWGGIKRTLTEHAMNELIAHEMERSGIENMPEVKQMLDNKREELMVSKMYDDLIRKTVNVTNDEMVEYYNAHKDNFKVPEKRSFGIILTGDREDCLEAYQKLQDGEPFGTVVQAFSIDEETKKNEGRSSLFVKGEQPEFDEVGFGLEKVGDVSEPFQTSKGWAILKLVELQRAKTLPFEQSQAAIKGAIESQRTDQLLKEKLDEWKSKMNITVYENNLKKADVEDRIGHAKSFDES